MHVLMITDAYPPMRTSCAVQMHDLAQVFIEEGHQVTIITPDGVLKESIRITHQEGVSLTQVRAFKTKDVNYVFRTFAEFINPFLIWHKLKKSPEFLNAQYDGIIWYSPTIFWGPLIKRLKRQYGVKAYLILRDIFPDWALDLGLLKNGLIYQFLKKVEYYQYRQADIIGLQSPNNLKDFELKYPNLKNKAEVLWNWIGSRPASPCQIEIGKSALAGRKIFVYAGNMGAAQGMDALFSLVRNFNGQEDIGFVFVGRGSEVSRLKRYAIEHKLSNVLFFDEIPPAQIERLYSQCHVGMISLDPRHSTHNIPGKFLTYMHAGLPVIAYVNPGNDLHNLIVNNRVGISCEGALEHDMKAAADEAIVQSKDPSVSDRCKCLADELFGVGRALKQIKSSLVK